MHLTVSRPMAQWWGTRFAKRPLPMVWITPGVIIRSGDWVALEIDEHQVWRGLAPGPLREIRFGEVHTDKLHGGELSIERLEYRLVWDG